MTHTQAHALYRFYNATGTLLYIGITLDPSSRWRSHAHEKPWWHEVTSIRLETYPTRVAVLDAERDAIQTERPLHNVVHNRPRRTRPTPPRHITLPPLSRASHATVVHLFATHRECPTTSHFDDPTPETPECATCGHQTHGCLCTRIQEVAFS